METQPQCTNEPTTIAHPHANHTKFCSDSSRSTAALHGMYGSCEARPHGRPIASATHVARRTICSSTPKECESGYSQTAPSQYMLCSHSAPQPMARAMGAKNRTVRSPRDRLTNFLNSSMQETAMKKTHQHRTRMRVTAMISTHSRHGVRFPVHRHATSFTSTTATTPAAPRKAAALRLANTGATPAATSAPTDAKGRIQRSSGIRSHSAVASTLTTTDLPANLCMPTSQNMSSANNALAFSGARSTTTHRARKFTSSSRIWWMNTSAPLTTTATSSSVRPSSANQLPAASTHMPATPAPTVGKTTPMSTASAHIMNRTPTPSTRVSSSSMCRVQLGGSTANTQYLCMRVRRSSCAATSSWRARFAASSCRCARKRITPRP
mmetsp:Transcript_16677/g.58316  ORF Transcript_16677/g.58316 Transcript_16677/m.58316 type:complete len:381 (-) Transcript_16677:401-1543(-)